MSLEAFTRAYLATALWISNTEDGEPLETNHDVNDIERESLIYMKRDAELFYFYYNNLFGKMWPPCDDTQAGHYFWLTRNGHGSGFWDNTPKELVKFLTAAAHSFGEQDLYVGDDGKIHAEGGARPEKLTLKKPPPHPAYKGGVLDWWPKKERKKKGRP